jgi:sugar phosphate isomerase/epimerase
MPVRLAVATEDFGVELKSAIAEASSCEVSGLRLNARSEVRADESSETALRQIRQFVAERQMTIAGLYFPSRFALYDAEYLDRRIQSIRAAMSLVRKLGTTELIIRCGRIPAATVAAESTSSAADDDTGRKSLEPTNSDVDSLRNPFSFAPPPGTLISKAPSEPQNYAMLCEILNDLVGYGSHVGCVLQLQMARYDIDRIQQLHNDVRSGPFGIVFDPATATMTGAAPVYVLRTLYSQIGYIRGRDALADLDGAGVEVAVGDGKVDWLELLPTIAETEYNGWLCVERPGGEHRAEDVRTGVSRIRQILIPGAG